MNIDPIIVAVRQATILCREVQHNSLRSINKMNSTTNDSEPVTIADYGSQVIIGRALAEHFPDDAVLAEEAGAQFLELTTDKQKAEIISLLTTIFDFNVTQDEIVRWLDQGMAQAGSERVWIIDPIDGTKGFVGMRHYAIGVGIVEKGQPTGAIVAAPGYGDGVSGDDDEGALFYIKDGIAYQEPMTGGKAQQLHVSDRTESLRIVQSYEKQHASKSRMAIVREKAGMADAQISELDSMEKYALVANGDADVYLRLPNLDSTRPHLIWDHAPGVALVLAAGGQATDITGEPLDFSQGRTLPNRGMIISNGKVHERLLKAVSELLAEEADNA
ncbi:MAG: inositol monophosphatase family protein [Anaerolineae bacterium]